MISTKDSEQDARIRRDEARIARNEKDVRRLTVAIEQIRDHFYPPPKTTWQKVRSLFLKVICTVLLYAGGAKTVHWYMNMRKSEALAERCAEVAHRLFFYEGDAIGATHFLEKAKGLDTGTVKYRLFLDYVKSSTEMTGLLGLARPLTAAERARADAALAEAMFLLETAPDEAMSHALAAQAYALLGAKDSAFAAADRAVTLSPDVSQMHVCACQVYYAFGDFEGARREIEDAFRLHPQHPLVLFWKGFLALNVDHDVQAARTFFEEMVCEAPRLSLSHAALGEAFLAAENPDYEGAAMSFRRALKMDPEFYAAMLGLGEIAMRTNDRPVARLWYDCVLRQDPSFIKALEARARLNGCEGDWSAAVADWTDAIALAPFRAELYHERAAAYANAKDEAHAAADRKMAATLEGKQL